jgi:hypothetical protein
MTRSGSAVQITPIQVARWEQQCFVCLSYMNADERREEDVYWREQYSTRMELRTDIKLRYTPTRQWEYPAGGAI